MVVVHEQLENVDGQGEVIRRLRKLGVISPQVLALKLRGQIVRQAHAALIVDAGIAIGKVEAVSIQDAHAAVRADQHIFVIHVSDDIPGAVQMVNGQSQIPGHLHI